MYIVKCKDGRRWKVREAASLKAACNAIVNACVTGSVGSATTIDDTHCGGSRRVVADVIQINSDGTERQPYTAAY